MTRQDIENIIEEEDVEFIRLQFTDVFGNLKNIAVTPGQMDRVLANKFSFAGEALFDEVIDYDEDLYLYPDLNTFVILPWRPQQRKVAKVICDVCYADGTVFEKSPRTILKKVVAEAKKEGYLFSINPECEFFLFHTDEYGNPTTVTHEKAGYMNVGPSDFGENARRDIVLTLEDMGFEVISSHHEKAAAQHEIDYAEKFGVDAADALMTCKLAVRSIAKRFGLYATFMPKPRTDLAGSGLHLHIALFDKEGNNIFENKEGITDEAKYFIGGIMAHAKGLSAITNPIVNSYKRLHNGFDAPDVISWSTKGEKCLVKYNKYFGAAKVELRFPDPASNPYLAIALCIAAGLDGIKNKIEPEEMDSKNALKLPNCLYDAICELKKDSVLVSVLGEDFVRDYVEVKEMEWNDYLKQVSEWEIDKYLIKM